MRIIKQSAKKNIHFQTLLVIETLPDIRSQPKRSCNKNGEHTKYEVRSEFPQTTLDAATEVIPNSDVTA